MHLDLPIPDPVNTLIDRFNDSETSATCYYFKALRSLDAKNSLNQGNSVRRITCAIFLALCGIASSALAQGLAGDWIGQINGGFKVRLHFEKTNSGFSGKLTNPSGNETTLDQVTFDGTRLHFAVNKLNLSFDGVWNSEDQTWKGNLTFQQVYPLILKRATPEDLAPTVHRRPQEDAIRARPTPYVQREVHFNNSSAHNQLAGTLSLPDGAGPFPAVVLISGTGQNTRDEDVWGHKVFLILADALNRNGVAVLRYDKRGVGGSTGDYDAATTADFTTDALAAVAWLKTQPQIDAHHIGVLGHSEGGIIAPAVAAADPSVAFAVMIAGPCIRGDRLFVLQSAMTAKAYGAPDDYIARRKVFDQKLYSAIIAAPSDSAALDVAKGLVAQGVADKIIDAGEAETLPKEDSRPWERYFLAYDPAPTLARLTIPVLVLNGSLDVQVPAEENLAAARVALKNNARAAVIELPGTNHLLQDAKTGAPSEYNDIEETMSHAALKIITDWLSRYAFPPSDSTSSSESTGLPFLLLHSRQSATRTSAPADYPMPPTFTQANPWPRTSSILFRAKDAPAPPDALINKTRHQPRYTWEFMSLHQANSAFNLLGQVQEPQESVHLPAPDASTQRSTPTLNVSWGAFHQGVASNISAIFSDPSPAKKFIYKGFFKDGWIEGRIPRVALLVALSIHLALVAIPFPRALTAIPHNPAFDNTTLTWSGPINDLPLLNMTSAHEKSPAPAHHATIIPTPPSPDAFHPRQRIFTDSAHPTHAHQTLINPKAPLEAPKILPALPNIVELQQSAAPVRPRMQIDQQALAKLHPRERRAATSTIAPPPDVVVTQQQQADLTMQATATGPARPKLALNPGAAPRLATRAQSGDPSVAPELGESQPSAPGGSPATLIALSAAPAPPSANVAVPAGNLSAQVSISPEGRLGAAGSGGTGSAGGAKPGAANSGSNPVTVSISGGSPSPKTNVSGLGGNAAGHAAIPSSKITMTSPHDMLTHRSTAAETDEAAARTGPPNFASLAPDAKPESVFKFRKIYTLYVNMPNLSSATGSWQLNFTELRANGSHLVATSLAAPVPTRKVDPKYPPTLVNDHVEGEIVLYAIIRTDGSLDSIRLVRGLDPVLDANSIAALTQWQFRPATKSENGADTPVELEAIVHIPFHAAPKP